MFFIIVIILFFLLLCKCWIVILYHMYSCKDSQSLCDFLSHLIIYLCRSILVLWSSTWQFFFTSIFGSMESYSESPFLHLQPCRIQFVFSSNRLNVSCFSSESLIHVVFPYRMTGIGHISFNYHVEFFFQRHLLKMLSFSRWYFWYLYQI